MLPNSAGVVYGTIAVAALLAAETARSETYAETVAAVLITLVLYWLAHAYSEFTGRRLEGGEPFSLAGFGRTAVHELSVLIGAAIPLLALVIAWIAGAQLTTAVTASVWVAAAMIVAFELTIAIRAHAPRRELVAQTAFGMLLGLLVIALRVVLH
jgi:hypothetical protein